MLVLRLLCRGLRETGAITMVHPLNQTVVVA